MGQNPLQDALSRIIAYDASYVVGFALMLLFCLYRCKAYGVSRRRAVTYSHISFALGLTGALLLGAVYNFLFSLKGVSADIHLDLLGAVLFLAVFLPGAVHVEKRFLRRRGGAAETVSLRDTMDLMIPGGFLLFACVKVGCFIRGCCFGVECGWGVTSPVLQKTVFPVQLFESISICIIIIFR